MWVPILVLTALCSASTHPVDDSTISYTPSEVVSYQRDINLVSYIQNFKQVMAEYVSAQYNNLTVNEMEKVKLTLEDFLRNFANDLRDTIDGKNNEEPIENVNDETFSEVKRNIIKEFPDVSPEVADRIVYKLKKNLYETRNKLDEIIRESARAQVENSQ
ncbi:hypothetical protein ABMA27_012306 [Loxostege sticticalis]|uniref:Uncharacterized protein n=1 Tax=Loxostege sticticalis TaxID=481309 RepID=A0ABR3H0U3_LOXSC